MRMDVQGRVPASNRSLLFYGFLMVAVFAMLPGRAPAEARRVQPPEPLREFRAAWIASVWNVDWPSRPGLSGQQQRSELIEILDVVADLKMNAVILQVRPEGDALYRSSLEPWSHWLSGTQGQPPSDGYDPLEFAVGEAHARGLELHAWFNPFRARTSRKQPVASNHVSRRHPDWLLRAGTQDWLNPAIPEVRRHVVRVLTDVVRRYDIDGVHLDDYFYPYPKHTFSGMRLQFDDSESYESYRRSGGGLDVHAWRRSHINQFVEELNESIKEVKPWLKFGISPFGIWRPGHPKSIEASLDSYLHLAGDSRTWLQKGWVDYLSPQLYWRIDQREQSFTTLTRWWNGENRQRRHLWPGIASSRIRSSGSDRKRGADESIRQIEVVRDHADRQAGRGHIHWSVSALTGDRDGIRNRLKTSAYDRLAVVPESAWLAQSPPPDAPLVMMESKREGWEMKWLPSAARREADVRWWVVQMRREPGDPWETVRIWPDEVGGMTLRGSPAALAVRAVDSAGQMSEAFVLARDG